MAESAPRLFIAVTPPAATLDTLEAIDRPADPGVRWSRRTQWHITLRFLGACDAEDAMDALKAFVADESLPKTDVHIGPSIQPLGTRVLAVPVSGVTQLAEAVVRATANVGEPPPDRDFYGHITLARMRKGREDCEAIGTMVEASFTATSFQLVQSELRSDGARYSVLADYPLV